MEDKDKTLAEVTAIRLLVDAEYQRHEAAMHEIERRLSTLEMELIPPYSAEEEAEILEEHIQKMT